MINNVSGKVFQQFTILLAHAKKDINVCFDTQAKLEHARKTRMIDNSDTYPTKCLTIPSQ